MKRLPALAVIAVLAIAITHPSFGAPPVKTPAPAWAVVNVDGVLARGRAAVASAQLGTDGQYEVVFDRDVSQCAYTASGGTPDTVGPDDAVVFTVAPREGNPNAVFVQEWDGVLGYDSYSSGFHLIVTC